MSYIDIDHRVTELEARTGEVEACHAESIYALTRRATHTDIAVERLTAGVNQLGHGIALMMQRMGVADAEFTPIAMPTDAEVDAALEADC